MDHRIHKSFLRALLLSALFVLLLGGTQVSAAKKTGFVKENGKTYYIKADGTKQKGWLELKGKKYYFNKKTGVQLKGWAKDSKGKIIRYFSKGTGAMATGFLTDGKKVTRYFEPETGLLTRGFKDIKGHTYYFTSGTGAMMKGWAQNSKGQKRYFSQKGRMAKGWLKDSKGRSRYFSKKTGIMYADKQAEIGGVLYDFDKNGIATPAKKPVNNSFVPVFDSERNREYNMWKTYLEIPGVADRTLSDRDILAALCETEAGDQGHVGMVAVALCVLNRTLDPGFPSEIRYVVFQGGPGNFAQYTVVSNGALAKRLNGDFWYNKEAAYKAADQALEMHRDYVESKKPRKLKGFKKPDFDYKYFMMESSYWKQNLDFDRVDNFLYKDHMFFVDWVSPKK